jgi:hypothetical protein
MRASLPKSSLGAPVTLEQITMRLWFSAGYMSVVDGESFPVAVVARDDTYGLVIYERLPINITVQDGLRRPHTRYFEGRLSDFEPCVIANVKVDHLEG